MFGHFRLASFVALLVVLGAANSALPQGTATQAWLEDFAQLKREMAAHYANLDWAVAERRMDLKQLCQRTETRLREVKSEPEARRAIEAFLDAFGDGHLLVRWPSPNRPGSSADAKPAPPAASLCARLGFREQKLPPGIAFDRLSSFEPLHTGDSKYFSIAVLSLADGKKVGLVRIALFSEYSFPDLCETAASELGLHKDSPCDDACAEHVERRAADLFTAALERQVKALRDRAIDALLVDITGNGGGTNWVEPAARTLTKKPLRSPRLAFIKHPHWDKQFTERLGDIEADLRQAPMAQRKLLEQAADTYRRALAETRKSAARDAIWENQAVPALVSREPVLYASGVLPYLKPGELADSPSSARVFYPSRYRYHEGAYSGPLIVLVDGDTASSAEYFAAMLMDNGAAFVVGSPTVGAGCGYTNGGIATVLKNCNAQVKMPDGARFRADGTNEVAGITPAILVPWRSNDSAYQKAKRVVDVLPDVVSGRRK